MQDSNRVNTGVTATMTVAILAIFSVSQSAFIASPLIAAIALIAFGGAAACLVTDFAMLIVTRCLVGAGLGMAQPLGNALVMRCYTGQRQATMQGIGSAIMNVMGIALQIVSGMLVAISIQASWMLHLVIVIPLVLVAIFLREPPKGDASAAGAEQGSNVQDASATGSEKAKLPASAILLALGYGISMFLFCPLMLNMSAIVISQGVGTAALAGILGALYSVGGMVAGVLFGKIFKVLGRRFSIPISLVLMTLSIFLAYFFASSAIALGIAIFVGGFAMFIVWPACMIEFSITVPAAKATLAASVFTCLLSAGGFLSSPYMSFLAQSFNADPTFPLLMGGVGLIILTVVWSIPMLRKKELPESA